MSKETSIGGSATEFPETRWTLIQSAQIDPNARREALDVLLASYWKPLYFYLRRRGMNIEATKDAVQGFYVHLLEQDFLGRPDPNRGRFRGYLRKALDNYLANLHAGQSALKRGGGIKTLALDFDLAERDIDGAPAAPDAAYDRQWALEIMERAMAALRREFQEGRRRGPFDVFADYFKSGHTPPYEQTADKLGMSVSQFKSFLHRTRLGFRELVRAEVAQTLTDPSENGEEIAELLRALRS